MRLLIHLLIRFQSTLPLRGATGIHANTCTQQIISIHAPLTGSDLIYVCTYYEFRYFNPRSPYGERRWTDGACSTHPTFQSTLPLRGATRRGSRKGSARPISIHAPLTGSDLIPKDTVRLMCNFNPRSPYGERQQDCTKFYLGFCLSSTIL